MVGPAVSILLAFGLFTRRLFLLSSFFFFTWTNRVVYIDWAVVSVSSCTINFSLCLDWVSLRFGVVVCVIAASVFIFTVSYISSDFFFKRFVYLVFMFVISIMFLIFIPSLPALLLGWDGLGIVSFALVIYYQNMKSLNAGIVTILINRVGDVIIVLSISIIVIQGHWMVTLIWDFYFNSFVRIIIIVAAITKRAQVPFSSWLPAAIAAPTPVSALVHSSTLVTAGVYLLIRFNSFLRGFPSYTIILLFVSSLTTLMAGIAANYENDMKKVIALSTLRQLGVMIFRLSIGAVFVCLFHLYTHALFKALLFLRAGSIIHSRGHNQDIRFLGSSWVQLPFTTVCLNLASLSLCGAPFLRGYYSKDLILELRLYSPVSIMLICVMILATGLTAAYSCRLSFSCMWNVRGGVRYHSKEEDNFVVSSIVLLSLLAIIGGAAIQEYVLEFNYSTLLPLGAKLIPIFMVVRGLYLGCIIWRADKAEPSLNSFFISEMWFLKTIRTRPVTKASILFRTYAARYVDEGWLEYLGGQGLLNVLQIRRIYWQRVQLLAVDGFILLIICTSFIILMYYLWWLSSKY